MKKRSASIISITITVVLCLLLTGSVFAGTPDLTPGKIDEVVTKLMKERNIPGLSLAISMPGKMIQKNYGIANKEHNVPVEKDTVFEIGSVSKTFTAIGILMLQQEKRLSVTDRLTKYFPQYPQWHDITLKHLLQHTSGIKEMTETEPFRSNQQKDWTPREVIARMAEEPLDFEPGQNAVYSNIGCIILGVVIEKVTGVSYGDFLNDRILRPLGMGHTMLGSTSAIIPKRASGYYMHTGKLMNAPFVSLVLPYASGGMTSTTGDLIKLTKVFTAKALLTEKSVKDMFAPARLNNGKEFILPGPTINMTFGYGLDSVRGKKVIPAKTGGISGFNTYFAYFPESQTMVALTANLDNSLDSLVIITDALFDLKNR